MKENPEKNRDMLDTLYHWSRGVAGAAVRMLAEVQTDALIRGKESWHREDLERAGREGLRMVSGFLNTLDPVHPQDLESGLDTIQI